MYYFLALFISIYGHPPSIVPEYMGNLSQEYAKFADFKNCEDYLLNVASKKYKYMSSKSGGNGKFLSNKNNTQFVICKKFKKQEISEFKIAK